MAWIGFDLSSNTWLLRDATFEEGFVTPEKQAGLIYQMLLNYFAARNTGLKENFIAEKTVHFGVLNI